VAEYKDYCLEALALAINIIAWRSLILSTAANNGAALGNFKCGGCVAGDLLWQ
jgi:hypothetical protein